MILLPWAAALALPKNEAKCLFSLRAHSVLPLISLPPSLLYGRQFQDSCPWIVSPHLQILFIHGPFTYVHSSVNILFQLQSLPFPPGHLFKMVICFHLFHQMFLHQGDLTRDFFSTFQKKCYSDTKFVSVFQLLNKIWRPSISFLFFFSLFLIESQNHRLV